MTASYRLAGPLGTRATLGLIVLQVDETIEHDFRRLCDAPDIALHVSRIPSGDDLTPDTIAAMEANLPGAASLLPPGARFHSIGYGCTSGTTLIGAARVAELLRGAAKTAAVADPLTAAIAALKAQNARRVGLLSPYIDSVAGPIRTALEAAGFDVPATRSFGEEVEARVARIDPRSIYDAVLDIGQTPGLDAVFVSCTNLRAFDIVEKAEAQLGLPVITSNLALAWQMFGHAGTRPTKPPGRLFQPA